MKKNFIVIVVYLTLLGFYGACSKKGDSDTTEASQKTEQSANESLQKSVEELKAMLSELKKKNQVQSRELHEMIKNYQNTLPEMSEQGTQRDEKITEILVYLEGLNFEEFMAYEKEHNEEITRILGLLVNAVEKPQMVRWLMAFTYEGKVFFDIDKLNDASLEDLREAYADIRRFEVDAQNLSKEIENSTSKSLGSEADQISYDDFNSYMDKLDSFKRGSAPYQYNFSTLLSEDGKTTISEIFDAVEEAYSAAFKKKNSYLGRQSMIRHSNLQEALREGDLGKIQAMVSSGEYYGLEGALDTSIIDGQHEISIYLLEQLDFIGDHENAREMSRNAFHVLKLAVEYNRVKIIEYVIDKFKIDLNLYSEGRTSLVREAIKNGWMDGAKTLITNDPEVLVVRPNDVDLIFLATIYGQKEMINYLVSIGQKAMSGHIEALTGSYGSEVPRLRTEAKKELIDLLIGHGADPKEVQLASAAVWGRNALITFLLSKKAPVDGLRGYSPLTAATKSGRTSTVQLLLESEANPNFMGIDGWGRSKETPLFFAIDMLNVPSGQGQRIGIAKLLMSHGADPNIKGDSNKTPNERLLELKSEDEISQGVFDEVSSILNQ